MWLLGYNGRVQKYVTSSCSLLTSIMVAKFLKFSKLKIGEVTYFCCYDLLDDLFAINIVIGKEIYILSSFKSVFIPNLFSFKSSS